MSAGTEPVSVRILDREYTVGVGAEGREALMAAAKILDGKMREIRGSGKVIGAERIAVMAALNIAHELLQRPDPAASATPTGDTREQVRELLAKVDRALHEANDPRQG